MRFSRPWRLAEACRLVATTLVFFVVSAPLASADVSGIVVLLDDKAQYSGAVPVVRMLLAGPQERLVALRMEPVVSLPPEADEKEVFQLFDKYNLRMLTVVDKENRPIGAIAVDDVVNRLVKN